MACTGLRQKTFIHLSSSIFLLHLKILYFSGHTFTDLITLYTKFALSLVRLRCKFNVPYKINYSAGTAPSNDAIWENLVDNISTKKTPYLIPNLHFFYATNKVQILRTF